MNLFSISIGLFLILASEAKILPELSINCDICSKVIRRDLIKEIAQYGETRDIIINYVTKGDFKGKVYDELATFIDKFGPRISGSEALEDSIDYMIHLTENEGIHNIVTEAVKVPHWVRGKEKITMVLPKIKDLPVLGYGTSVSTPPEGIIADVIVIHNFKELDEIPDNEVYGKIVLFSPIFTTYKETVVYRSKGATRAAKKGAVAALLRTVAPFSINSPHTGRNSYAENVTKIPTAAITLEDADMITRMVHRGERVVLHLEMFSTLESKISRNTIIDYEGTENPEKMVIVSGHIDSWDVGQGAMDDGGGIFISWAVPVVLNRLNLIPKRSIRTIFYTAEEMGKVGGRAYAEKHKDEFPDINIVMESDEGTFAPLGLKVAGSLRARCIIAEILKLFKSINASALIESETVGQDIIPIVEAGVPGATLYNKEDRYFWFHHSEGDTMNVEDPNELDLGAAFWTTVAYITADLSVDIPRS